MLTYLEKLRMCFQTETDICVNQSPTVYHIQLPIILFALESCIKQKFLRYQRNGGDSKQIEIKTRIWRNERI